MGPYKRAWASGGGKGGTSAWTLMFVKIRFLMACILFTICVKQIIC